jgi:multiple sugar transport system ATP-binding protein
MQVADPLTLYRQPQNLFVAGFIGSPPMNLLRGRIEQRQPGLVFIETAERGQGVNLPLKGPAADLATRHVGKDVVFGVRPEHLTEENRDGRHVPLQSTVDIAEPMGSESLVYLKAGTGSLIARIHGEHLYHMGQPLTVYVNMEKISLFDAETENVIR